MKIGIIGLGSFGTALANYFSEQDFDVLAWTHDQNVKDSVNNKKINTAYFPNHKLHSGLNVTNDLSELYGYETLFLMLPALAIKEVAGSVKFNSGVKIINCAKGLCEDNLTPVQMLKKVIKVDFSPFVLSGPGFAKDILNKKPIGFTLAGEVAQEELKGLARNFSSQQMRIYTSNDVLGVELGGILKNVIAIAAGISDGLGFGDSARAGLITRGLVEISKLGVALGAKRETFFGLSGLGDLVLTASVDTSRNRRFGLALGSGSSVNEALTDLASTVEGAKSAKSIVKLAKKCKVEMPLSEAVVKVLEDVGSTKEIFSNLIVRPIKTETE